MPLFEHGPTDYKEINPHHVQIGSHLAYLFLKYVLKNISRDDSTMGKWIRGKLDKSNGSYNAKIRPGANKGKNIFHFLSIYAHNQIFLNRVSRHRQCLPTLHGACFL